MKADTWQKENYNLPEAVARIALWRDRNYVLLGAKCLQEKNLLTAEERHMINFFVAMTPSCFKKEEGKDAEIRVEHLWKWVQEPQKMEMLDAIPSLKYCVQMVRDNLGWEVGVAMLLSPRGSKLRHTTTILIDTEEMVYSRGRQGGQNPEGQTDPVGQAGLPEEDPGAAPGLVV